MLEEVLKGADESLKWTYVAIREKTSVFFTLWRSNSGRSSVARRPLVAVWIKETSNDIACTKHGARSACRKLWWEVKQKQGCLNKSQFSSSSFRSEIVLLFAAGEAQSINSGTTVFINSNLQR